MIWMCMMSYDVGVCEKRMNNVNYIDMLEQVLELSVVQFYDTTKDTTFSKTKLLTTQFTKLLVGSRTIK